MVVLVFSSNVSWPRTQLTTLLLNPDEVVSKSVSDVHVPVQVLTTRLAGTMPPMRNR